MKRIILLSAAVLTAGAQDILLDSMSVTATKVERETKEVPQSVTVVSGELIEERNVLNAKDALATIPGVIAVSGSNGYDARLIIRGAGLKARYGIREIMVMRDGVPMTDPDSFSRMDFIDVDDMESIEVYKGPGSIMAANTSGGVVAISSKSVFDTDNNRFKVGYGSYNTFNANIKASYAIDANNYVGVSVSRRQTDNDWREWNKFDTTQAGLKYGHIFEDDATLEMEFSFSDANLQLPQSLKQSGFDGYLESGDTTNGDAEGAWQKSGRYSQSYFFNMRYEKEFGDLTFKPQVYLTKWDHFHPVTGMINQSNGHYVGGLDLGFDYKHQLFGNEANIVFGATGRADHYKESEKYEYRDYETGFGGRITRVTSDEKGTLSAIEDGDSALYGFYLQESLRPVEKLIVDIGLRYDRLDFDVTGDEFSSYDYAGGKYVAGSGSYELKEGYNLYSPKIGATYALTKTFNIYGLIASANQAPTDSEVKANFTYGTSPSLKASTSINYEVGMKQRSAAWSMDFALYYNDVRDEIVAVKGLDDTTYYANAGKTKRLGAELSMDYFITDELDLGATGSWYDYSYVDYVDSGVDYSGNQQRFIPDYQYSLFAGYRLGGFSSRFEGVSYGPYYMDDANTEKYDGYTLITNLMLAYQRGAHKLQINANNIFNKYYAIEADKVVSGSRTSYSYDPGMPRSAMLTYSYAF
ncbi:MAG: TonB-dependent receptor [Thiovulaceae bacterium]|nr:TonB-dependent receptor [Sulfurimonadaceae bacterium]